MLWHTCPIVPDFSIKIVGTYFMAVIIPTSADSGSESLLCLIRLNKMLVDSHYLSTHYCEQYSGTHLMHYIVLAQFIVWNCKIFFFTHFMGIRKRKITTIANCRIPERRTLTMVWNFNTAVCASKNLWNLWNLRAECMVVRFFYRNFPRWL